MTASEEKDHDADLIARLRAESGAVRDCFTQFSFNAIALSSAALGVILSAGEKLEYADFAAIPFIGLLIIVSRIGIYKYSTSNRLLGYELHLFRTAGEANSEWKPEMRKIDWEAALRAWRVVQPAIFRSIYKTPEDFPRPKLVRQILKLAPLRALYERSPLMYRLRPEVKKAIKTYQSSGNLGTKEGYPWFHLPAITRTRELVNIEGDEPRLRANESGLYHAGSYLRHMLAALSSLQLLLLIPMCLEAGRSLRGFRGDKWDPLPFALRLLAVVISLVVIIVSKTNAKRRREMIESGLLSIHSCAIIWQAVILAHSRALNPAGGYTHYTEALVEQAMKIATNPFDIHTYIRTGTVRVGDRRTPHLQRTADAAR